MKPVIDLTEDERDRVIEINLKGVWNGLRFQIPVMLEQSRRAIVNTGSVPCLEGFPSLLPSYIASKYGVVGLTAATARTYASQGIRVNAICPGAIDTALLPRIGGGAEQIVIAMVAENPSGRLRTPNEVAEAVIWLCSDRASFVTGQTLTIDGGFLA